jgi:tripartite-type tricarboxylate transporter receptor subunit TctC
VTIVAAFAPGALADVFARLMAEKLQARLGKPFVVENKAGVGQLVGTLSVIRSEPDGHTILLAAQAAFAANVTLYQNLAYDPATDLVPLYLVASVPQVLLVNADFPIRSLTDLISYAKSNRSQLTFGSTGPGTAPGLAGEIMKQQLNIELSHIHYRSFATALNDLAGGHINLMFTDLLNATPVVQAGKARMIGVATRRRIAQFPDLPTLAEQGLFEFDMAAWFMFAVPAKTPPTIIELLYSEMKAIMAEAEVKQEFIRNGLTPIDSPSPSDLKTFVASEITRWGNIIKSAGVSGTE